jgi:Flp pilus assembly protein TadD
MPAPSSGKPVEPAPSAKALSRVHASLRITDQGRQLLLGGQVEEAISVLERATGMNPDNGEACYWLAEAWLKKGNAKQALEYHHQAWLRLRNQPAWNSRLRSQRERMQGGGR